MLDADTRRRIDTARDILVGKVPDPKSQVEQITIALIYKFMDDIDADSEELGGERSFFAGEFARYGWARLMQPGLGGHEMLNLYAEAIERMDQNAGIPQLFRDIFNNAYLPYRDPETLRAFLKQIDEFTYDHSERLGDAFEYLLSVMDSQGDAGQFRTPRHIIDFIVAILDPKKEDVVLDPACGTAGFLISSYKHILAANTDADDNSTLTPDEKERLANNIQGYDISPDMVRLSLVNMYLHDLVDPKIVEYDTLTSDERWGEYADVILANPPFMSPKGGIRPHNRFSVISKRSEVLFVDYMAEHLTSGGRAGIIVPEGIIFQSQNAYKQLRKMLVEEYLVAVVSLPAGVFNPYSGVKTSILILDKALSRRTDCIAFFKVENDGFGLGAQRRPVEQNDLPQVEAEIVQYLQRLRAGESGGDFQPAPTARIAERRTEYAADSSRPTLGLICEKERVAADGEYNLSGERYREDAERQTTFPKIHIGDLLQLEFGTRITKRDNTGTLFPVYGGGGESFRTDAFNRKNDVVISRFAMSAKCVRVIKGKFFLLDSGFTFSIADTFVGRATKPFVTQILLNIQDQIFNCARGHAQKNIDVAIFRSLQIPLPPLEVQQEIVAEIEGYQKVIDGAWAVVENYRPHIHVDPDWPMVALGELCERPQYGLSVRLNTEKSGYKTFRMNELVEGKCVDYGDMKCADISTDIFEKYRLTRGDILFNRSNSFEHVGRTGIFDLDGMYCFASYLIRLSISKGSANPFYINAFMNTEIFQGGIKQYASRAIGQANINARSLAAYCIPLPPLEEQQAIVAEIQAEQTLVNANRELIERMEKKIQDAIARVWEDANSSRGEGTESSASL